MNLEQQLQALDVDLDRLEAEPLIDRCFEIGFFPWDNPKFLVFLHATIQAYLTLRRCRRQFLRGLIYARHITALMPESADPDIYRDLCAWANLQPTGWEFATAACAWPHRASQRLFGIRFWRIAEHQAEASLRHSLRLAQAKVTTREQMRSTGKTPEQLRQEVARTFAKRVERMRNRGETF